jgi:conjugal transfer/entry exclusion protein
LVRTESDFIMRLIHRLSIAFIALVAVLVPRNSYAAPAAAFIGTWHGSLQTATGSYTLELTLTQRPDRSFSAAVESVDQAPSELIPVSNLRMVGDGLAFDVASISARYDGRFDPSRDAFIGTWSQGMTLPLVWALDR